MSFPFTLCEIQESSTNFSETLGFGGGDLMLVTVLLLLTTYVCFFHESPLLLCWKPGQLCILRHGGQSINTGVRRFEYSSYPNLSQIGNPR